MSTVSTHAFINHNEGKPHTSDRLLLLIEEKQVFASRLAVQGIQVGVVTETYPGFVLTCSFWYFTG